MKKRLLASVAALGVLMVAGVPACNGDGDCGTPEMHEDGGDAATTVDAVANASGDAASASSDATVDGATPACILSENDAGTCNAVDVLAPLVSATCSMAEPPQATGGVIEDGVYALQSFTDYGVCPTSPDVTSTTWQICGNHWDVVQVGLSVADGGPSAPERFNFITSVQAAAVDYTQTCGATVTLGPRAYTASPGQLTFVYPDVTTPGRTLVSIFAKQ